LWARINDPQGWAAWPFCVHGEKGVPRRRIDGGRHSSRCSNYRGDALDHLRGYRDVKVKKFDWSEYDGYFDRPLDQWESIQMQRANWNVLPPPTAQLGERMIGLGIGIVRSVLRHIGVPEADWPVVTQGVSERKGHEMIGFNHYRSDKKARGTKFHRDTGWVTILRITEPGLYGWNGERLGAINPVPGYFVVNFGSTLQVLTEHLYKPVCAAVHGVAGTVRKPGTPDRTSYAVFVESPLTGDVFRYEKEGAQRIMKVADFIAQENKRIFDNRAEV
jgi:hypothetical protein